MVQTFHNQPKICIGDRSEITVLRYMLSDQTVHVQIRTSFPGSIRVSKIEIRLQCLADPFVFSKFLAIIRSESMKAISNRLEQLNLSIAT